MQSITALRQTALRVREHIIKLATNGGCFIGASLSCADLFVYLYSEFMNIAPEDLDSPDRDFLLLSKGHDVPALYGTFAELGYMPRERLQNHLRIQDSIYWHPSRDIAGVEFHSGSLGHLLSVAVGIALDCKLQRQSNKVIVVTGDGELNEGSNWEACLVASAHKLDNLIIVVDRNGFQANTRTEALIPLEMLSRKFEAFGCATLQVDGHDFAELHKCFTNLPFDLARPSVVIANTVRGKGLPSLEARADRWFCNFTQSEIQQLLRELHTQEKSKLTSEELMVR